MAVEVNEKPDVPLLTDFLNEIFDSCHLRTGLISLCHIPLSIEILA